LYSNYTTNSTQENEILIVTIVPVTHQSLLAIFR